jgi:hypothetical protein
MARSFALRKSHVSVFLAIFAFCFSVAAAEPLNFFTNVADRLLQRHLNLSVSRIAIAPTNQYSPEAHRLLQVAANLYDATHSNAFPSVFQPIIGADPLNPGGVAITNFVHDPDVNTLRDWLAFTEPYRLPMIIGAKKGIPNFNEFVFQTTALAARKLELIRPTTNSPPTQTNDMFVLGISNYFAFEAWNSYSNAVSSNLPVSDLTMIVANLVGLTLTNSDGLYYTTNFAFNSVTNVMAHEWGGFQLRQLAGGFIVPAATNITLLTNSVYRENPPRFDMVGGNLFERDNEFRVPQWHVTVSNRAIFVLYNEDGRILDFANLDQMTNTINLSETLLGMPPALVQPGPTVVADCWNTNRVAPATQTDETAPTMGIIRQLLISRGEPEISQADWNDFNYGGQPRSFQQIRAEISSFRSFLGLQPLWFSPPPVVNTNLVVQAPFTPTRKFVQTVSWQADDPLVHHMVEHLRDHTNNISTVFVKPIFSPAMVSINVSNLNNRYRPWTGNPLKADHPNDSNRTVKDAGVLRSDDWIFPTNLLADPGLIGRVHRGTPWQTIYLKSEEAALSSWQLQFLDARSHPTSDWKTVSILLPLLATNDPRNRVSVNDPDVATWQGLLHGMTVLSNLINDPFEVVRYSTRNFATHTIESNSPQAQFIAEGIQNTRANRRYFARVGDILSTPELTIASPFLNTSTDTDLRFGLTDEAYEKIPEQLLPRLRSEPVLTIHRQPSRTEITVEAFEGYTYRVQASSDLQTWHLLEEVFANSSAFTVIDNTSETQTFYRAQWLP